MLRLPGDAEFVAKKGCADGPGEVAFDTMKKTVTGRSREHRSAVV